MSEPDNYTRADWADTAVKAFRDDCAGTSLDHPDGYSEAIGDLIANLGHLANRHKLDFESLVKRSVACWREEVSEAIELAMGR